MGRLLAFDYGKKRVGLAVTDPLQIIATALETVPEEQVLEYVADYVAKEEVVAFIIGMPIAETDSTAAIIEFAKALDKKFPNMEIHFQDESHTSQQAVQAMVTGGVKKKDRQKKENVDLISAVLILQRFMGEAY